MRLADLLDRCLVLEERAGAVYRMFAAAADEEAELWAGLAVDEEEHARSIRKARGSLASDDGALITVDGDHVRLAAALLLARERLATTAGPPTSP